MTRDHRGGSTSGGLELTFIGNATVLLRFAGLTILTDPNFLHRGDRAKLGAGLRSRRLREPAMGVGELPPLDLIVLSHHHGDHIDEVATRELDKDVPVVTTRHAAGKLHRAGFRHLAAPGTWESRTVSRADARVKVTALPATHAPGPLARLLPPVMGSLLEFEAGDGDHLVVYVSGDTLVHDRLEEIRRRYPEIDLGLLHLGGTRVLGVLLTMDAAQGLRALEMVRPKVAVPVHFDDYTVFTSPLSAFLDAARGAEGLATEVVSVARGETRRFRRGAVRGS